jgi:hypothetical protein
VRSLSFTVDFLHLLVTEVCSGINDKSCTSRVPEHKPIVRIEALTLQRIEFVCQHCRNPVKVRQESEVVWVDPIETVVHEDDAPSTNFRQISDHVFHPAGVDALPPTMSNDCKFFVDVTAFFAEIIGRRRCETCTVSVEDDS